MKYPFSKILVTGGSGFIGSHFISIAAKLFPRLEITNIDSMAYATSPKTNDLFKDNPNIRFIKGDISEISFLNTIFQDNEFDCVINFAAESHVDNSISSPSKFISSNIIGTFNLLEVIRIHNLQEKIFFHHISTDEVYGSLDFEDMPFKEGDKYFPSSPYSASKAASDLLVQSWHKTYGMKYLLTNCSNNFGPRQFKEKLIPKILYNALEGKKIPIYGNGLNVRDWIYVEDHINAIIGLHSNGIVNDTYNIGGNNEINNLLLTKLVLSLLSEKIGNNGFEELISHVLDRPGHDLRYSIDSSKIDSVIGTEWKNGTNFKENLKITINWYIENPNWWND